MAKILMADDSGLSRKHIVQPLAGEGHDIIEAKDGQQAWELFQEHAGLDCVVTDLLMPNMDGTELLAKIRESGSIIPVIVVSADIQESSRELCESLGISSFLNKPAKAETVIEAVREALGVTRKLSA